MKLIKTEGKNSFFWHSLEDNSDFVQFREQPFSCLLVLGKSGSGEMRVGKLAKYLLRKNLRNIWCEGYLPEKTHGLFNKEIVNGGWAKKRKGPVFASWHGDVPLKTILSDFVNGAKGSVKTTKFVMIFDEESKESKKYIAGLKTTKAVDKKEKVKAEEQLTEEPTEEEATEEA